MQTSNSYKLSHCNCAIVLQLAFTIRNSIGARRAIEMIASIYYTIYHTINSLFSKRSCQVCTAIVFEYTPQS